MQVVGGLFEFADGSTTGVGRFGQLAHGPADLTRTIGLSTHALFDLVEFSGQIRPFDKQITYELEVHRYSAMEGGAGLAIGSGRVLVDGKHIYSVRHLKAGVFPNIRYDDYPNPDSPFARGGERSYT